GDRKGREPQRAVPAAVGTGHHRHQHAQPGQPAGGAVRRAAAAERPRRAGGEGVMSRARAEWTALSTIVRKEVRRFLRIWLQTLLPSAITMTLYFVIFGRLIGSRIGDMGGFSYIQFV